MAESVLGGILGGEEERAEEEAAGEALAGAEAFAAAIAADHAKFDPEVAAAAADFLRRQSHLLQVQANTLVDEAPLRLSHLRSQSREGHLRRAGQRIRLGMQVFTAFVIGAIALGVLVMVVDAFTSRSVVVDAFQAPSALAARGVTGDVVASGVLDALQKLQQATRSTGKHIVAQSAWSSDVKIEVPETGVSIGEINRLLHARFGHDIHIGGDLVQTETGGLALTVRGDGVPAKTFEGAVADLDKLSTQAAEYIYGRSQPVEFAAYLSGNNRDQDALAFLPDAFGRATNDEERATFANLWGNAYGGLYQAAAAADKYRLAMSFAPHNWKAWGNLVGTVMVANGEEAGWREARAFLRAMDSAPRNEKPQLTYVVNPAIATMDLPLELASSKNDAAANSGAGAGTVIEGPQIADVSHQMHDPASVVRYMALSDPDDPTTKAEVLLVAGYAGLDRGDAAAAIPPLEQFWKAWLADPNLQYTYQDSDCYLALAYGLAGRMADAEAVFKRAGPWSRCYAYHGDVLEHAGDLAGAERMWAEGLRIAPDMATIYLHRGLSELNRNDLKDAAADLSTANAKSPHFADPLKAWGDVLAREGRWREALAKYTEALTYAPAWVELHQVRDAAARHG